VSAEEAVDCLRAVVRETLQELDQVQQHTRLLEAEGVALRSVLGVLMAELAGSHTDPQETLSVLGGRILAHASAIALHLENGIQPVNQVNRQSPVALRFTKTIEAILAAAEDELTLRKP